jgi:hypothetical protein
MLYLLQAKWHVRVSKQSFRQGNFLILWGVCTPRHFICSMFPSILALRGRVGPWGGGISKSEFSMPSPGTKNQKRM